MFEVDAVEHADEPGTVDSPTADLRALGVECDDILLVHSSFSSLGWVAGGPQTVIDALQTVSTDDGTPVMSTHTGQCTDPSVWENPPVPDDWVEAIGESMPPFRLDVTPIRGMDAVPEYSHNYPGVARSEYPTASFAARGTVAEEIVGGHELDYGLGNGSLLARVHDHGGDVPLLGVGHGNNTSLRLAEHRADFEKTRTREHAPLLRDDERVIVEYDNIEVRTDDFEAAGEALRRQHGATEGPVTVTMVTLLDQPALAGFAEDWFEPNR